MICGKRVKLRAIEYEDLPLLVTWRNDAEVYRHFYEHEPLSLAMQQKWFERFLHRESEKFWIAETLSESRAIGTVGLVDIDWRSRRAEVGRVLIASAEDRKCGYGREMLGLLLGYAFQHLNLNRLYLEVFSENEAAIDFYRKVGFVEEGICRQHVFARGQYRDVKVLSLLREEYA